MIDLKKALDQEEAAQYIDMIMSRKRRYFSRNLGKHIRVEMLTYQFSFQIGYSFDQDDEFPNLFHITVGIFSLNIDW